MGNVQIKVRRPAIFREFINPSSINLNNDSLNSVLHEEWVDGRRVISSSPYTFPVDPDFMDTSDMQHYINRKTLSGKNYLGKLKNPKRILDAGTGSGMWAKDMGREFPKAKVYALDMVEDMFNKAKCPPNVVWEVANLFDGTRFDNNYFDYVHQRLLIGAIPDDKIQGIVNDYFRITKRGGTCCLVDPGNIIRNVGPKMQRWHDLLQAMCVRAGVNYRMAQCYEQFMREAGFVDIKVATFYLDIGGWAGDMGAVYADVLMRLTLMFPLMIPDLISHEEVITLNQEAFGEELNHTHPGMQFVYVTGKKP
jgi:ubiquinone/menaquinone biosynthesis C-methylase UbiE